MPLSKPYPLPVFNHIASMKEERNRKEVDQSMIYAIAGRREIVSEEDMMIHDGAAKLGMEIEMEIEMQMIRKMERTLWE